MDHTVQALNERLSQLESTLSHAQLQSQRVHQLLDAVNELALLARSAPELSAETAQLLADLEHNSGQATQLIYSVIEGLKAPQRENPYDQERLSGLKILVVDDHQMNLEVAQGLLEDEGAQITTALNGWQALEHLFERKTPFDLVLMDINMPVMNGLDATRQIRARHDASALPVIALSAGILEEQINSALQAGMNGYIAKPIDLDSAIDQILGCLTGQQDSSAIPTPSESAHSESPLFDPQSALSRFSDAGAMAQYLTYFLEDLAEYRAALDSQTLPAEEIAQIMHRLAGVAGNFSMERAYQLALELEAALIRGEPAEVERAQLSECLEQTEQAVLHYLYG